MSEFETEDQQLEEFKRWWKENGKMVMLGSVLGFAAIFGGNSYLNHLEVQRLNASVAYDVMTMALEQQENEQVMIQGQLIVDNYPGTPYAALASLALAKAHVEDDELGAAQSRLQWIVDHEGQPDIVHVARLRLAQVLFANDKADQALTTLTHVDMEMYEPMYQELRGDIYLAKKQMKLARTAYVAALGALDEGDDRRLLEMKIDDLGV